METKTRLLVAEDSATQAEQVRATLEDHGYDVCLARNGREGLAMAQALRPTLIISDVVMPEMDGYRFCRAVKTHPDLKEVPFILLTSLSDPVDVVRGLECGADNFLVKPYDERYLVSRISFMLANRHLRGCDYAQMGVEILFAGSKYFITSDRLQILNLLLSTYETAVQKNHELLQAQTELKALAESLDEKVRERTAQLQAEVDERRRAEEDLQRVIERERKLSEQLQRAQKMEAIGRLAGGIAHDFNNLLTVINGSADLLLAKNPPDEFTRDMLQEIGKAGERAAGLTGQLLAFSRKSIIKPTVLDLNERLRDLGKMLRRLIGEDIELTLNLAPDLKRVRMDPSQIDQAIMNLAVNSRDAMPNGGKLVVETRNIDLDEPYADAHVDVRPGNYVLLSVSDNGMGMDQATQAHIFEPFFTTKDVGKGTGLGLATTYGIVSQGGGHIAVYSEPGMGTTIKIHIPACVLPDAQSAPIAEPASRRGGSETILLVEDEDGVRRLTRIVLESNGYKVLEAAGGRAAMELALHYDKPIDILLTDVIMPGISGHQVAEALRGGRFPGIKVLYMSGYTDDAIVRYGVLEAEMPFLQKPFTPGVLAKRIRETLDNR